MATALLLALTACMGETVGPVADPTTGALYGKVVDTGGEIVTDDADVSLYQITDDEKWSQGFAVVFSLGLLCAVPGVCPAPIHAELSSKGFYSFPKDKMKQTPVLAVTASRDDGKDGLSGATTSLTLPDGKDPQQAPDLMLWEPDLRIDRHGSRATVRWPELPDGSVQGSDVKYTVWVQRLGETSETPQQVTEPLTTTSTSLDLRTYEDQPTEVMVSASTKAAVAGQEIKLGYQSAGQELPLLGPPPSRDRACLVGDAGKALVAAKTTPCPVTDGDLEARNEVLAPGDCSASSKDCQSPSHDRLCVDLGKPRSVSLFVFRTPFGLAAEDMRLETSLDGRHFSTVGRGRDAELVDVNVRPARTARYACLHDTGVSGSLVSELSVW